MPAAKKEGLERLAAVVDFEVFRPELKRAVPRADRWKGGRPPFGYVLMFKTSAPSSTCRDRLTWMRFLGLGFGDPVPDANTIWTFVRR